MIEKALKSEVDAMVRVCEEKIDSIKKIENKTELKDALSYFKEFVIGTISKGLIDSLEEDVINKESFSRLRPNTQKLLTLLNENEAVAGSEGFKKEVLLALTVKNEHSSSMLMSDIETKAEKLITAHKEGKQ